MNILAKRNGAGYALTPYRIEFRPQRDLHKREELKDVLDLLYARKVKAWWYSVAARGSIPLFRSKALPFREDADTELYRWLVEEAHDRGIAMFSWEYLNTAPLAAAQHPEWRFRYFGEEKAGRSTRDDHFVCYNSPYGELLKQYCLEVVGELGFDGIWFDGCYMHSDHSGRMACRCSYCTDKYRQATGQSVPETVDYRNAGFRRFADWRYDDFTAYWRSLSRYIRERKENAIIALNYFNRIGHDERSGSPLRRMPMDAMIASESCSKPYQLLLQHRTLRALNDNYPTEVWDYFRDAAQHASDVPEPEPASMLFHARCSATAGGYASFGFEAPPSSYAELMSALSAALDPIAEYVGGEPERCIALVLSGATKDYAYVKDDGCPDAWQTWKAVHGMHNLLNSLHWPTEILLDNMLTPDFLNRFKAVILPDVRCLSDASAAHLQQYVERGGFVLLSGACGILTELGEERKRGALDEWFGIKGRDTAPSRPLLDIRDPGLLASGIPSSCMLTGTAMLMRTEGGEVLAAGRYRKPMPRHSWSPDGIAANTNPLHSGDAIVRKSHGNGAAVWLASNVGAGYAEHPSLRTREAVGAILGRHLERPFRTDAPANVVVTRWEQEGRTVFHLLNMPQSLLHLPANGNSAIYPEDFTPTRPISIRLTESWQTAYSPSGGTVRIQREETETCITLDSLEQHAVIVLNR
ncbi:hypothetical protein FE784_30465 [Paenibacillus hemerocallicola]|uniref:Uncharacterized protein n=1 Tax=Paenibacillus hemerocallicola TaxID=1172614 RepID=A0A5C4T0I5_9BACL|nr:alpha-amylase family protein [Paenibacillus hemerocallicola]TNJ62493.1 hypothetical protein FE784_30465 [Paenibacillus hemerocallicola]